MFPLLIRGTNREETPVYPMDHDIVAFMNNLSLLQHLRLPEHAMHPDITGRGKFLRGNTIGADEGLPSISRNLFEGTPDKEKQDNILKEPRDNHTPHQPGRYTRPSLKDREGQKQDQHIGNLQEGIPDQDFLFCLPGQ